MREISLDQLRTLVTIADCGSFSEAACLLNLAAPTVSLHISSLETRVGAKLLSRTRRQIRPTAIGENLVEYARRLLADVTHALEEITLQAKGLFGRVRLAASTGVIANQLPAILEKLSQLHPNIHVQLSVLTSQQTIERIVNGSLDIGIVALPQANVTGLKINDWRRDPVVAFMPSDWISPPHITPLWISEKPLILNSPDTHLGNLINNWFAEVGRSPKPLISLDYNDAIKNLVAAGYGATLLPLESGTLLPDTTRISMATLIPELWRELGIVYRENGLEPATKHVLSVLCESI